MNKSEKKWVLAIFIGWFFGPAYFYYHKRPMKVKEVVLLSVVGPVATVIAVGNLAKEIGEMKI